MRTGLLLCIPAALLLSSVGYGVTLTFDEVQSGTALAGSSYYLANRVSFSDYFYAADHSESEWGHPHSGRNVLTAFPISWNDVRIHFGRRVTQAPRDDDHVLSVLGYFSTSLGTQVRITPYHIPQSGSGIPLPGIVIGVPGESWDNRLIEINTTPDLPFEMLRFEGVNSYADLAGFCLDDMTITLVPEPSSLLALAGGLGALQLALIRRRRNR